MAEDKPISTEISAQGGTDPELRMAMQTHLAEMLGTIDLSPWDRALAARESEWLATLYVKLREHLEKDIDRQWAILRLFVPLSLGPFVGVAVRDDISTIQVAILGLASVALLVSANLFSDRLSHFLKKTWMWIAAIEAETGLPQLDADPFVSRRLQLRKLRWGLVPALTLMWVAAGFAV